MDIFKVVFIIIGTLIGAGFASGQEVYAFFFSYGIKGLYGIALSSILIGIIIYKTLKIIKNKNIEKYKDFLDNIIKSKKLNEIINITINIFLLTSFYVMIAGFGAYLKQEFNINQIVGSSILSIICYMVFKTNIKGIIKINEILIPILLVIIILIRNIKY